MRVRTGLIFLVLIMLISCTKANDPFSPDSDFAAFVFPVTGVYYDIGNPSPAETLYLELINRARANPSAEGAWLINTGDSLVNYAIGYFSTNQGSDFSTTTNYVYDAFQLIDSQPPLAFNRLLNNAALTTSTMQRDYDTQDHYVNGSSPSERVGDAGYIYYYLGENIYANSYETVYGHAGFNVDWGNGPYGIQDPPGHRNNIHSGNFREIGICVLTEGIPASNTGAEGPQIVSQELATAQNDLRFITGVVYNDIDGDQFYDENEGLSGVTVSIENGDYYTLTGMSGAYTIPFNPGVGEVRIQAGSADFDTQVLTITLSNINYKLDFNPQETGANGAGAVYPTQMSRSVTSTFEMSEYEHGEIIFRAAE